MTNALALLQAAHVTLPGLFVLVIFLLYKLDKRLTMIETFCRAQHSIREEK
jgi:hypothetical protein